ncbi:C-terminal binding protein [Brooklawnia propionicigenes]|uniref:C-terminal binding protein n=1 Tax=Brooklawnia propionicigenes TaxID=3041175 RepID=A0AAN0KF05_9ACTN|nr:C-terminal binding protein [Brooklawnia sp. SH051]BEH01493.1 C-terminal binding protein [Brooklawnia sp. SH051]
MRVTITDLDHDSWAIEQGVAEAEGVEFQIIHGGKDAGLDPRVKGSNGLLVQYADITAEVMDYLLPELKVIGRYGVGVDTIDLDAAEQRGIVVVNVPDYGTQSVADHAITLALAVARNLSTLDALARKSTMDLATAMPIHQFVDQTFGVLGFGAIGQTCANKARGLGFQTQVCDVMIPQGTTEVDGFPVVSQDELLATSDIISVHVPLIPATKHLFNDETFAKMKDGAIIVNTARGGVIDTDALIRAVESGKLRGAGLDVLEIEPVPADSPLLKLNRVILSPHAAYYSEESYFQLKRRTMQNVIDVLKGRECKNIVVPRKK